LVSDKPHFSLKKERRKEKFNIRLKAAAVASTVIRKIESLSEGESETKIADTSS
jgi:hypothetical protein